MEPVEVKVRLGERQRGRGRGESAFDLTTVRPNGERFAGHVLFTEDGISFDEARWNQDVASEDEILNFINSTCAKAGKRLFKTGEILHVWAAVPKASKDKVYFHLLDCGCPPETMFQILGEPAGQPS